VSKCQSRDRNVRENLHNATYITQLAPLQQFHSRHGKAYLFNSVVNVYAGSKEERLMTTGLHTVSDIYCNGCMQLVGWRYVSLASYAFAPWLCGNCFATQHLTRAAHFLVLQDEAFEQSQKYKEGKFILERDKILECHSPISDCQHTLDDSDDEV